MDERSLAVLELPAIRARLAAACAFGGGRGLAEALEPSPDPDVVARRQGDTAEGLALLEAEPPRLAGAHDVRPHARHAERGGTLPPDGLLAVGQTLATAVDARRTLLSQAEAAPSLAGQAAGIDPELGRLAEAIERAVEPDGSDLRDDASPPLRRLRRALRESRARAEERLRQLAASSELAPSLQEGFITERGGRPVLVVRAAARSAVPGIVHDASGSGQTLFVEPFAVVELHNRVRELQGEEREEIERILAELSRAVADAADAVCRAVDVLAALDVVLASAELSARWRGAEVQRGDEVLLLGARHPLLDPGGAVPIDLPLGGVRAVVISGANTGGKTVALKTLGLAALLHQSGLRPPAERAVLPVFDEVLADIGDEQSIEQSLSTFSGHLRNLREILRRATPRSLVLLDEVAAGTDPVEGSALAQALLARLVAQGTLVLTTTHYPELKEWAGATDAVTNAAVGFDPETLAPTYTVTLGRPGPSHALQIAERLGLDRDVVQAARDAVGPERRRLEELLAEAAAAEQAATRERREADALRLAAEQDRAEAAERERELSAAVDAVRAGANAERDRVRSEAEERLSGLRRELDELRGEIRSARRQEAARRREPASRAGSAERERDRRLEAASTRSRRAAEELHEAFADPAVQVVPLAVGDPVQAPTLGVRGTIVEISGDTAEVHGGGIRVRVPLARLAPDPHGGRAAGRRDPPVVVRATAPAGIAGEIDVRGQRADEAREAARGFVDAAHLAGRDEVRIVHGRGTGAVRGAVRDELARHPLVDSYASESADGATLVRLAAGRQR